MSSTAANTTGSETPGVVERLGRYDLIHRIGSGGMAEVFVARQRGPMGFEKLVVVKKIHEHLARQPSFIEMLLKEARVSALLKNQHIVDIYDLGHEGRTYFIAMEYLAGQPLTKVITTGVRKKKPLPFDDTAHIIACAAAGLDAAHNLTAMTGERIELIHRDVSPGNIVVLYDGNVKLVDFGIAKAHGEVTNEGGPRMLKGKAGYVSPEQIEHGSSDRRADIFALGIVMWECLTLRRLFRAEDDVATLELIQAGKIRPPSYYRREVPAELDRICLLALATDPAARYQHAREMRADLDGYLRSVDYRRRVEPLVSYLRELFAEVIDEQQALVRRALAPGELAEEAAAEAAPAEATAVEAAPAGKKRAVSALPLPPPSGTGELPALGKKASRSRSWPALPLPLASPDDADPSDDAATILDEAGPESSPDIEIVTDHDDYGEEELSATQINGSTPGARASSASEVTPPFQGAVDETGTAALGSRRRGWVLGGVIAAAALIVVVVLAARGGDEAEGPAVAAPASSPPAAALEPAATEPAPSQAPAPAATAPEPAPSQAPTPPAEPSDPIEDTVPDEDAPAEPSKPEIASKDDRAKPTRDPERAAALYKQGFQAFVKGDMASARKQFAAATRADRSYAPAQRGLGLVAERTGDARGAIRAFEKYLRLNPNAEDAGTIRARIDRLRK